MTVSFELVNIYCGLIEGRSFSSSGLEKTYSRGTPSVEKLRPALAKCDENNKNSPFPVTCLESRGGRAPLDGEKLSWHKIMQNVVCLKEKVCL